MIQYGLALAYPICREKNHGTDYESSVSVLLRLRDQTLAAVLESNEKESGVTIHLVDEHYDTGEIVAQTKVEVFPNDSPESLCDRVMQKERQFVVEVLNDISLGRITL